MTVLKTCFLFEKSLTITPITYPGIGQSAEVWFQIVDNAQTGARKRHTPDEQDCEHDVGEDGREVDHFAQRLDAFQQHDEDEEPAEQQAEQQLPAGQAELVHAGRLLQDVVPKQRRESLSSPYRHFLQFLYFIITFNTSFP